jgi:hypothetical protein
VLGINLCRLFHANSTPNRLCEYNHILHTTYLTANHLRSIVFLFSVLLSDLSAPNKSTSLEKSGLGPWFTTPGGLRRGKGRTVSGIGGASASIADNGGEGGATITVSEFAKNNVVGK